MSDAEDSTLTLYGYPACPYCAMVLGAIRDLKAPVELRDTLVDPAYRKAALEGTGRTTVPVLRIDEGGETRWMPESKDIVAYLYERFGDGRKPGALSGMKLQRGATMLMWSLLVAGLFFPEQQPWLWLGACVVGTARSILNGVRTRSWFHFAIAAVFAFACASILLRELGVADVPWWYAAYGLVGLLAVLWLFFRRKPA
ncbi:MAG: glutaredoxin family protein [Polyangiales bacterium]